ncbi:hypothetical protein DYB32_008967 [Aphanomyces invadans]|uniref:CCHC-type domain-containing protein n=1 Tax=Aphanomyces invadans TaxID=157072 RepID=A0A3R6WG01_9STRA|nr:hypothetical protein DYB32_008967 [Aphanomyces invadans]
MDPFSKRRIVLFDLNKDHNAGTEAEWIAWFNAALEEEPQDLDVLKKSLAAAIRFDMKILGTESRAGRMLDDLMRVLEQDHQEWVLTQEPKVVVEVMTKAIKPEAPRLLCKSSYVTLQLQRNKGLKNDVFRFVNWLRHFAAGFQLYVGVEELQAPVAPLKGHYPKGGSKNGASSGGSVSGGGDKTDEKGVSPAKTDDGKSKEDKLARKKIGCLKCGDTSHRVAECPKVAPGEADRLLEAQLKKWCDGISVLGDKSTRLPTNCGATVEALVRSKTSSWTRVPT